MGPEETEAETRATDLTETFQYSETRPTIVVRNNALLFDSRNSAKHTTAAVTYSYKFDVPQASDTWAPERRHIHTKGDGIGVGCRSFQKWVWHKAEQF